MQGEYKVFKVGEKYQIFWCPSAPVHYSDRRPYDDKTYTKRQAAYRRCKQLNERAVQPTNQYTQQEDSKEEVSAQK